MEHEDDPDIDEPYVPPAGNVLGLKVDSQLPTEQPMGNTSEGQKCVAHTAASIVSHLISIFNMTAYVRHCLPKPC